MHKDLLNDLGDLVMDTATLHQSNALYRGYSFRSKKDRDALLADSHPFRSMSSSGAPKNDDVYATEYEGLYVSLSARKALGYATRWKYGVLVRFSWADIRKGFEKGETSLDESDDFVDELGGDEGEALIPEQLAGVDRFRDALLGHIPDDWVCECGGDKDAIDPDTFTCDECGENYKFEEDVYTEEMKIYWAAAHGGNREMAINGAFRELNFSSKGVHYVLMEKP